MKMTDKQSVKSIKRSLRVLEMVVDDWVPNFQEAHKKAFCEILEVDSVDEGLKVLHEKKEKLDDWWLLYTNPAEQKVETGNPTACEILCEELEIIALAKAVACAL